MKFYHIKDEYIDFLKKYDKTVADNKNESRPYVGTIVEIDGNKYYAPFTSPKPKHQKMKNGLDFRKIDNGKLGAINLNNMIPVVESAVINIKFDEIKDIGYKKLLQKQYAAINKDSAAIEKSAKKLHKVVFTPDDKLSKQEQKVKSRCCNIPLLEEKAKEFEKTLLQAKENRIVSQDKSQPTVKKKSIKDTINCKQEESKRLYGNRQHRSQHRTYKDER